VLETNDYNSDIENIVEEVYTAAHDFRTSLASAT
jgi:hypothetical protein